LTVDKVRTLRAGHYLYGLLIAYFVPLLERRPLTGVLLVAPDRSSPGSSWPYHIPLTLDISILVKGPNKLVYGVDAMANLATVKLLHLMFNYCIYFLNT